MGVVNKPDKIRVTEQIVYSADKLGEMKRKASTEKWEGLMLRMDWFYKGKRSQDMLKVKHFETEEYKVIGIETGPMRVISPETGLEVTIDTLKSVVIHHKGNPVNVGSGV